MIEDNICNQNNSNTNNTISENQNNNNINSGSINKYTVAATTTIPSNNSQFPKNILEENDANNTTISSSEDIEHIRQEQNQKIENLKTLLIKAKQTIQKLKSDNKQQDQMINDYKHKNEQMEVLIKKYIQEEEDEEEEEKESSQNNNNTNENKTGKQQSQPSEKQKLRKADKNLKIQEIQAKIVLNGINWVCIKFDNYSIEWLREEHIKDFKFVELNNSNVNNNNGNNEKQQENTKKANNKNPCVIEMPTCIDYNRFAQQEKDNIKSSQNFEQDLKNVIGQYEERIKRMQENQETAENTVQELQQKITEQKQFIDQSKANLKEICRVLVDESESIRENCLFLNAEDCGAGEDMQKEKMQEIKFLLIKMQKLSFFQQDLDPVDAVKDHMLVLHQTLFDVLKRVKMEKQEWQNDLQNREGVMEKLNAALGKEKKEKTEILEQGRKKIKELETAYEKMKSESILQMKEKDVKLEFLNKELNKNVNNMYLKNILIKFFQADKKTQKKMFNGIATVLQFSEDEVQQVQSTLFGESGGVLAGFFGFGGK